MSRSFDICPECGETTFDDIPCNCDENKRLIFSERLKLEKETVKWCEENGISPTPFNIITAIQEMGYKINL